MNFCGANHLGVSFLIRGSFEVALAKAQVTAVFLSISVERTFSKKVLSRPSILNPES